MKRNDMNRPDQHLPAYPHCLSLASGSQDCHYDQKPLEWIEMNDIVLPRLTCWNMTKHDASIYWILGAPPQNLAGTARLWSGGSSATASWPELKLKSWQIASLVGCSSVAWFQKCTDMKQKYKPKQNDPWDPDRGQVQMLRISRSKWHESCRQAVHGLSLRIFKSPWTAGSAHCSFNPTVLPWIDLNTGYWKDMHVCMSSLKKNMWNIHK